MRMVNRGSVSVPLTDFGIEGRLEPGGVAELPDGYCLPRLRLNGSRQPSIIEDLWPQLQPSDPKDAAEVKKTPVESYSAPPPLTQVASDLARQGKPPAVVELLARGRVEANANRGRRKLPTEGGG